MGDAFKKSCFPGRADPGVTPGTGRITLLISLIVVVGSLLLHGCATVPTEDSKGPGAEHKHHAAPAHGNLGIPPGHLPPPGDCRIWFPGHPPGHQLPSDSCAKLEANVPTGAWLIYGTTKARKDEIRVSVYDETKPKVVISVRFYDFSSGRFLREEMPGN